MSQEIPAPAQPIEGPSIVSPPKRDASPFHLLVLIAASVFVVEAFVMILLIILPPMQRVLSALLDAALLTALIYPILYQFVVRPMTRQIHERRQAEAALSRAYDELDSRVRERTTELAEANESLQVQIAERQHAGEELKAALDLVQRRQAEMAGLLTGARAVLEYRDFTEVAHAIYEVCRSTIGATAGYVALPSEDRSNETPVFLDPGEQAGTPAVVQPLPILGLREQAYMTGRTVYTNDPADCEGAQWLRGGQLRLNSVMFAPMTIKGFVVGVLGLANKPGGFSDDDARLAAAFAEMAAIAVLNGQTIGLLESSEKRFRTLAQATFEGITLSENGIIYEANEQFAQMHGYRLPEVIGRPIVDFLAPQEHERARQAFADDGKHAGEYRALRKDGSEFLLEVQAYRSEQNGRSVRVAAQRDITLRKQLEDTQTFLLQCGYPGSSEDFFESLARYLADSLAMNYVCIDRLEGDGLTAQTVAIYNNGGFEANISYALKDTPCGDVVGKSICCFPKDVSRLFPRDAALQALSADSYIGTTLWSFDGKPIGLIAVIGRAPLKDPALAEAVLKLVAVRAAGELERKRMEEALRHSQAELERRVLERTAELAAVNSELRLQSAALQAAANGIMITDRQGSIQWVNPAFTQMMGYSAEEVLGRSTRMFKTGMQPPEFYQHMWTTILSGQVWRGELINRHKDGSPYVEEQTIAPVLNERGEVANFVAVKQDVTERIKAEEALRASELRFRTVADFTYDWEYWVGPDQRPIYVSPSCERITGYAAAEFTADPDLLARIVYPDDRELYANHLHLASEGGDLTPIDFRIIRRDGQLRWIGHVCQPVSDQGRTLGRRISNRDITSRKQAEARLEQNNRDLLALSRAERDQRQLAETLTAANQALTQSLNLETVLETVLDCVEQLVPYDSANVMLLEAESRLAVRVARGYERWGDAESVRALTVDSQTNPVFNTILATRQSQLLPDTRTQPGWEIRPGLEHVRSWLGVPLVSGGNVIGLYSLDKTEPDFFTLEHVRLAEMLVGQAAVAIQNAWLFEQVRAGRERLQSLSRRLVEAQEAERQYVARELHDEAGQALTSLLFGLGQIEQQPDDLRPAAQIVQLKEMTKGIMENLHRLAMNLRPASLDHLGLVPALLQHVKAVGDRYGLIAQFKAVGLESERLPSEVETALYRIVQEALTNVVRHAMAMRVDVLLERRGDRVVVVIEDNGLGFGAEIGRFTQEGHLGLVGMQERAEMLGGSLIIESTAGSGTTVVVEVPYGNSYPGR